VSKNQVAERFGVSRARVCQLLNLLELHPQIMQQLRSINNVDQHNFFTEHRRRKLAIMDQTAQLAEFDRLKETSTLRSPDLTSL